MATEDRKHVISPARRGAFENFGRELDKLRVPLGQSRLKLARAIAECRVSNNVRAKLLSFARRLDEKYDFSMQIGPVSEVGPVGRSAVDPRYKQALYDSRIVLHANPDPWEGDARTWEALSSWPCAAR